MDTVNTQVLETQNDATNKLVEGENPNLATNNNETETIADETDEEVLPIFLCLQALRGC